MLKVNKRFKEVLRNPSKLSSFLERFSSQMSPEKRFELALQCKDKLGKLDLRDFSEMSGLQLERLVNDCPNLTSLNLSKCIGLAPVDFYLLDSLKKLKKLDVSHSQFNDICLPHLPPELLELSFMNCEQLTAEGLKQYLTGGLTVLSPLKNLKVLNLSNTRIDDAVLHLLPQGLQKLYLINCQLLKADGLKVFSSFKELKTLDLTNTSIDDEGLRSLPQGLQEFSLVNCQQITANGFKALSLFKELKVLILADTLIDDEGLRSLPQGLQELNLMDCQPLTADGLEVLRRLKIKKISITNGMINDEIRSLLPKEVEVVF